MLIKRWSNWLLQSPRWLPTLVFIPSLYLAGWLIASSLSLFGGFVPRSNASLVGTLITFALFLGLLPSWVTMRWGTSQPWQTLGIFPRRLGLQFRPFLKGLIWALLLILLLLIPLLLDLGGEWVGAFSLESFLNAICLGIGVGFAEELIFRSWLWGELDFLHGKRLGIIGQALIFSLVHVRIAMMSWSVLGVHFGLFLLGLVLVIRRTLDNGSLWGCVGLHGGLVGGWFFINSDLIEFSSDTSAWWFGPGGASPNPLGGVVALCALIMLIWVYRTVFAIAGCPTKGARNDSSNGAIP